MSEITTATCRAAIVDWLMEKEAPEKWHAANLGDYLRKDSWKRRTKTVTGGSVFRSFTCGSVNALGEVASLEVVESDTGHLTVRIDAANQPREFLQMLAIKAAPEVPVDRGPEFGSW